MVAANLSSELRREQTLIADRATAEMLAIYGSLNFKAIDFSAPGWVEASVSVAQRYHAQASALGADMYLSMRRDAGVAGQYRAVRPALDERELRRALIVLGPIAAKNYMSQGIRIPDAARQVFTLTAGRVSKSALAGARDAITASTVSDSQAVAYARQVGTNPCDFCLTMAENTYKDAYSAMYSAGTRKRAKAPQPMGSKFHDHCKCTVVPLFDGQIAPGAREKQAFAAEWAKASRQGTGFRDFIEQKEGFSLAY